MKSDFDKVGAMIRRIFRKQFFWILGITFSVTGSYVFGKKLIMNEDRALFLPGRTTNGHYMIEEDCDACHTPFLGIKQEACLACHKEDLDEANDSHPEKKFRDPRNADRLQVLNASKCVTCHVEHKPAITRSMGVTMPNDYCFRCHSDIGEQRPSHAGLEFISCNSAGCHNFHDNRALYEDFLLAHAGEKKTFEVANLPALSSHIIPWRNGSNQPSIQAQDAPANVAVSEQLLDEWHRDRHYAAGVNCTDCHTMKQSGGDSGWTDKPNHENCRQCHADEVEAFLRSRHGMRLANGQEPLRPDMARLSMQEDAGVRQMTCNACHGAHRYDTRYAAADACLHCHADSHTLNYPGTPHERLWRAELAGETDALSGVSCATCHMPRIEQRVPDGSMAVRVQHNPNYNLRPNEKMVRSVCLYCHGLQFIFDALADNDLVEKNFTGIPAVHIESIEWALRRVEEKQKQDKNN